MGWADSGQMPTKGTIIHGLQHTILGLKLDSLIREVRSLVGYPRIAPSKVAWTPIRIDLDTVHPTDNCGP
jgi:hypothetical protein